MKTLVIGQSGFIGLSFKNMYKHDDNFEFVSLRLDDKFNLILYTDSHHLKKQLFVDFMKKSKFDVVIILSWKNINDHSLSNLLENMYFYSIIFDILSDYHKGTLIVLGSCWEYGKVIGEIDETNDVVNPSSFGMSKLLILNNLKDILSNDIRWFWVRPFYVYGDNQKSTSLIPSLIKSKIENKTILMSSPCDFLDFIHVDDLIDILNLIPKTSKHSGVINAGSGFGVSVRDIYEIVLGNNIIIPSYQKIDIKNGSKNFWSSNKILKELSWTPKMTVKKYLENKLRNV